MSRTARKGRRRRLRRGRRRCCVRRGRSNQSRSRPRRGLGTSGRGRGSDAASRARARFLRASRRTPAAADECRRGVSAAGAAACWLCRGHRWPPGTGRAPPPSTSAGVCGHLRAWPRADSAVGAAGRRAWGELGLPPRALVCVAICGRLCVGVSRAWGREGREICGTHEMLK